MPAGEEAEEEAPGVHFNSLCLSFALSTLCSICALLYLSYPGVAVGSAGYNAASVFSRGDMGWGGGGRVGAVHITFLWCIFR